MQFSIMALVAISSTTTDFILKYNKYRAHSNSVTNHT